MQKYLVFILLTCLSLNLSAQIAEIRQKARAGDPEAMLELSEAFRFGLDVGQSEDSADYYINEAVKKGHPEAQYLLGVQNLISVFSSSKYAKGMELVKKAAQQGLAQAQWKLSEIYNQRGTSTQSDRYYSTSKAFSYAESAAKQGHMEALVFAGEALLKGRGTTRNDSMGVAYMRRAADEHNFMPARLRMGDLYFNGTVTSKIEPFAALSYYKSVKLSDDSNIEQRTQADLAIHEVDEFIKQVQNHTLNAGGWTPPGAYEYLERK